jgi:hypothetical protein
MTDAPPLTFHATARPTGIRVIAAPPGAQPGSNMKSEQLDLLILPRGERA